MSGFSYPDILEAAKEMTPKKYLVYIITNIGFAWPNEPWFMFDVIPIAPCLPPNDGVSTPEMCVPVFPNTRHPSGRMHIHTNPQFPYDNCYHWSHARQLTVRIRAKPEQFDDDRATKLEPRELLTFWELSGPDRTCEELPEEDQSAHDSESCRSSTAAARNAPSVHSQEQQLEGEPASEDRNKDSRHPTSGSPKWNTGTAVESPSMRSFESASERSARAECRSIVRTGIFGDPHEDKEVYPLVDLWVELADTLKQNDIPRPEDFYKEYDMVENLVVEAKMRRKEEERLETSQQPIDELEMVDTFDGAQGEPTDLGKGESTMQKTRKSCRPKIVIRDLHAQAVRVLVRIKHALRLPYVSIWP
ncbi:hypothetical protein GSI_04350 [Ganoderma sinense ZZ0214-1]|uniref:Uncharacterized protein n=1 Tax=Ganoderma sinense ZZ0214-1 TaxID=1077348 RepID=A0A2G8SIX1_9APHY|nr:hypothetical protein GSI_04350 [Ganoderma sinense ZZ0214-1]